MSEKIQIRKRLTPEEANLIDFVRGESHLPEGVAVQHDQEILKLKDSLKQINAKYSEVLKQLEDEKRKNEFLSYFDEKEIQKIKPIEIPKCSGTSESIAMAIASDWHFEETVLPGQTAGINEFNLEIANKRAERFFVHTAKLIQKLRHTTHISVLVVALLGDLISGYIHDELMENNSLTPVEATMEVFKVLRSGLDFLITKMKMDKIIIPCCVGNHARTTKKFQWSTAYKNSYEYIVYYLLADLYKNNPDVEVVLPEGYHVIIELGEFTVDFSHGNGIGYRGGIGGLYVPANRIVKEYQDAYYANHNKKLNLCVFGHHHTFLADRSNNWISNGSLIGYNSYGHAKGFRYQKPEQAFLLINNKWRDWTFNAPIFLEDKR